MFLDARRSLCSVVLARAAPMNIMTAQEVDPAPWAAPADAGQASQTAPADAGTVWAMQNAASCPESEWVWCPP